MRIPDFIYVLQEDFLNFKNESVTVENFYKLLEQSEQFCNIGNDKKNDISTIDENYCKIPSCLLINNEIENDDEVYCMLFCTWIYTYSKQNHSLKLSNVSEKFKLSEEEIRRIIEKYGEKYFLDIKEYKDMYSRRKKNLHFCIEKYGKLLVKERVKAAGF